MNVTYILFPRCGFLLALLAKKQKLVIPENQDNSIDNLLYETCSQFTEWAYLIFYPYKLSVTQTVIPALVRKLPFRNKASAVKIT